MEKGDKKVTYKIIKNEGAGKVDMEILCNHVIHYIQNNEIYFNYEPTFFHGVLIFGIIGLKKDHKKLKKELGKIISDLKCELQ
jgi:hypothetical protein